MHTNSTTENGREDKENKAIRKRLIKYLEKNIKEHVGNDAPMIAYDFVNKYCDEDKVELVRCSACGGQRLTIELMSYGMCEHCRQDHVEHAKDGRKDLFD